MVKDNCIRHNCQYIKDSLQERSYLIIFKQGSTLWRRKELKPIRYESFKILKKTENNACQLELLPQMDVFDYVEIWKLFESSMLDDKSKEIAKKLLWINKELIFSKARQKPIQRKKSSSIA